MQALPYPRRSKRQVLVSDSLLVAPSKADLWALLYWAYLASPLAPAAVVEAAGSTRPPLVGVAFTAMGYDTVSFNQLAR